MPSYRTKTAAIGLLLSIVVAGGSIASLPLLARDSGATEAHESFLFPAGKKKAVASKKKKQRKIPIMASANVVVGQLLLRPNHSPNPSPSSSVLPVASHPDILENHQRIASDVLKALPLCERHLKNFYVRYDRPKNRGLGGKSTIILDGSVPDGEFAALLTHECGHVIHGNLVGSAASGPSIFRDGDDVFFSDSPVARFFAISWSDVQTRRKGSSGDDFVSGYAQVDPFEDFAETFAAYVLHPQLLRARAQTNSAIAAKFAWMDGEFSALSLPVESKYTVTNATPWDITKLAVEVR